MMDGWLVGASTLKKLGMRGFARFFYIVALMSIVVITDEMSEGLVTCGDCYAGQQCAHRKVGNLGP